jgi:cupin fold WbuC family metalloprotein
MKAVRIERISPQATKSCHERVAAIDMRLIASKSEAARKAARGREIHIFHRDHASLMHRMLNAMQPGSYVPPHRHLAAGKPESVVLLQGSVGFVPFLDSGAVDDDGMLTLSRDSGVLGFDCRAEVWHTFFALERDTVVFEVKKGPFDAAKDKEFAPWAPAENDPEAPGYLADVEDRLRSRFGLPARGWHPE